MATHTTDKESRGSSLADSAPWLVAALLAGLVTGWLDLSAQEVQGSALLLMLAGFVTALPGGAPVVLIGLAAGMGVPVVHATLDSSTFSAASFLAVVPAMLGAAGGRIAGKLLAVASTSMDDPQNARRHELTPVRERWYRKPVSTRVLLAIALTAIAALGMIPVSSDVTRTATRVPLFIALVWQISTYVAWIALTPSIVRLRVVLRRSSEQGTGASLLESVMHVVALAGLVVVHAAALVALTKILLIPPGEGGAAGLFVAGVRSYSVLDALVYATVLGIAFASDSARHAREQTMRETALSAEATHAKLGSLRSRLNPHFLYNALNSVVVLANEGRQADVVHTLEELSSMLRYVLDESRSQVPLTEEIDFVRRYLEIQTIRFGDRLRWEIDSSAELGRSMIPPLILQPLAENAVEHGIAASITGGTVRVRSERVNTELVLTVEDDGSGLAIEGASERIGLGTTRARLERMYGEGATVTLAKRAEGGAMSVIRIPIARLNDPV